MADSSMKPVFKCPACGVEMPYSELVTRIVKAELAKLEAKRRAEEADLWGPILGDPPKGHPPRPSG